MTYYNLRPTLEIQAYTDNTKVIEYHNSPTYENLPHQQFFDDYDYYLLLHDYKRKLIQRGIIIHPIHKVKSVKSTSAEPPDLPHKLHRQMDSTARNYRYNSTTSPNLQHPISQIHLIDNYGEITSNEKEILETHWSLYQLDKNGLHYTI